jgi:hypothetical protein
MKISIWCELIFSRGQAGGLVLEPLLGYVDNVKVKSKVKPNLTAKEQHVNTNHPLRLANTRSSPEQSTLCHGKEIR